MSVRVPGRCRRCAIARAPHALIPAHAPARDGSLQRRMDGQLVSQEREASRVEAAFLCSFRR